MAYNPFNIFRRNQKAIFAVITVFIMFTFVLSSGLGGGADFFDWLPNWLGKKTRKGDHLCTIDGTKVYRGDLESLRAQRFTANKFMALAAQQSLMDITRMTTEQRDQLSPEVKKSFEAIDVAQRQFQQQMQQFLPLLQSLPPDQIEAFLRERQEPVRQAQAALRARASAPETPPGDREVIEAYFAASELARVIQQGQTHYFVNAPNKTERDLIEFMIWEKKADQLGIKFTDDDVKRLIQREFYNQFKNDVNVRKQMQEGGRTFSMDATLKGIGAEFRVRMAQRAYLGPPPGEEGTNQTLSAAPVYSPPYEVFDFYREKFSPTTYQVLAIPGRSMAYLTQGAPKREELEALWQKHKDKAPDPSLPEPGLQDTRRVKVGWIGLTGSEPYYRKLAVERLEKREAGARLLAPFTVPVLGMGPGWAVNATRAIGSADRYFEYLQQHEREVANWSTKSATSQPVTASFFGPLSQSAATATHLSSLTTLAGPYDTLGSAYAGALRAEQLARRWSQVRADMQLWYGAVPGPGFANLLPLGVGGYREYMGNLLPPVRSPATSVVVSRDTVPAPLPPTVAAWSSPRTDDSTGGWTFQQIDEIGRRLAQDDLKKLRDRLDTIVKENKDVRQQRELAQREIDEFRKVRGLKDGVQYGDSTKLRDKWTLSDDPALAPLESAVRGPHRGQSVAFDKSFFEDRKGFDGKIIVPARGVYRAGFFPDPNEPMGPARGEDPLYLTWRTEEFEPDPKDRRFNEDRALWAWKVLRGRERAKAEAEAIVNRIQAAPDVNRAIKEVLVESQYALRSQVGAVARPLGEPKAADRISTFSLTVAPLSAGLGRPTAFSLTKGREGMFPSPQSQLIAREFPYPTPEMEQTLLDRRAEPPKTAFVLEDKAKEIYYVVMVEKREVRTPDDFQPFGDAMTAYSAYEEEARKQSREAVLQLVKQEVGYKDEQTDKIDSRENKDEQ